MVELRRITYVASKKLAKVRSSSRFVISPAKPGNLSDQPSSSLKPKSFTLDIPPSNVCDENTEDYLTEVDAIFERVVEILRTIVV